MCKTYNTMPHEGGVLDQPWSVFIRLEAIERAYTDFAKLEERRAASKKRKPSPVGGS